MNSALMMTERKTSSLNGASNGNGNGQGAMINALRKLYDPVLEEPIPEFLLRAASMSRAEAQAGLPKSDASETATAPNGEDKASS